MTKPPMTDPRTLPCPACAAPAGQPCTEPTDNGRRPVRWFHVARESRAQEAYEGEQP